MRWSQIGKMNCSIARTLSIIGDRWTMMVLRDSFLGVRRFEDFQSDLGVSRRLLADRLRKLERHGILERRRYQENPPRDEYRLTEKGLDLYPIIVSAARWGDKWTAGKSGPPIEFIHKHCGHKMTPTLGCSECREPVAARDVRWEPGPHMVRTPLAEMRARQNELRAAKIAG